MPNVSISRSQNRRYHHSGTHFLLRLTWCYVNLSMVISQDLRLEKCSGSQSTRERGRMSAIVLYFTSDAPSLRPLSPFSLNRHVQCSRTARNRHLCSAGIPALLLTVHLSLSPQPGLRQPIYAGSGIGREDCKTHPTSAGP